MSQEIEALSAAFHEGQRAFNRGDFRAAVATFAPDFEWWPAEDGPEPAVAKGPDAVAARWENLASLIPDWHVETVELSEVRDGVLVVRLRATGSGATSGAPGVFEFSQVWEHDDDGVPVRCREFTDHVQALAAAAD